MASTPDHVILEQGILSVAFLVDPAGRSPARDLLESDEVSDQDKARLAYLFQKMAGQGCIRNTEHFKKLEGRKEVHEFKAHQARVFAFRDGNCWFLTNGVVKQQDKHRRADIDRAERIWEEHRSRKQKKSKP
jgi:hypothetical protein